MQMRRIIGELRVGLGEANRISTARSSGSRESAIARRRSRRLKIKFPLAVTAIRRVCIKRGKQIAAASQPRYSPGILSLFLPFLPLPSPPSLSLSVLLFFSFFSFFSLFFFFSFFFFLHFNDSAGIAIAELRESQYRPAGFRGSLDNLLIKSRVNTENSRPRIRARIQARVANFSKRRRNIARHLGSIFPEARCAPLEK